MVILTLPAGGSKGAGAPVGEGIRGGQNVRNPCCAGLGWCWLVTLLAAALPPPSPFITNMAPYRDTRISTANSEIRSLEKGNLSYTFS